MTERPNIVLAHEVASGHVAVVSHPDEVTAVITTAAESLTA